MNAGIPLFPVEIGRNQIATRALSPRGSCQTSDVGFGDRDSAIHAIAPAAFGAGRNIHRTVFQGLTHGGMGYAKEFHVERLFREIMIARIAPISRELVLSYIGERQLDLPKSY